MKTLVYIGFIVLLAAGLVYAGWFIGYRQKADIGAYAVPLIDRRLADALSKAEMLHLMDSGHYSDARAFLQGQFNMNILAVQGLESGWDDRRKDLAQRICAKMVAYRNEYPSNYLSNPALGDTWTVEQVDSYLKKVSEEPKK